jgi:hypothetical protein
MTSPISSARCLSPVCATPTDGSQSPGELASLASTVSLHTTGIEEYRIWLDVDAGIYARVSFEDYAWALQWKWQITWDRHKRKAYATRSASTHGRRRVKYYLHKEVLARKDILPPTPKHTMGDHGDGDSLNCERWNLSWATPSMNRRTARPPMRRPEPPAEDVPF